MKKLLGFAVCVCVGAALSLGSVGCTGKDKDKDKDKEKNKAGKASDTTDKMDKGKDKKIEVAADPSSWTAKPGDKGTIKLKLTRGKEATKEAMFTSAVEGKGVTAKLEKDKIAGDATEDSMTLMVADDAAKGDATVTVTVKSDGSPDATTTVKVKIEEKKVAAVDPKKDMKDMKLEIADGKAVMAKLGDKKAEGKVPVVLGKDLKGVALKFEVKMPKDAKGVEAKVAPEKMDASGDATVTLMIADDATPGEYWVMITASGDGAMPATAVGKVGFTIAKK